MTPKPVSASSAEFTHLVLPPDTNALGTIFGGRIMEWVDIAGSIVASRHCRQIVVTASMDALHFLAPVKLGDIVILKAAVNFTHRTSLEIGVRIESENPLTGERRHTSSAYLTFVALDAAGRPVAAPEVLPQTEDEKRRFEDAKKRYEYRVKNRPRAKK
ncbi:MAG TPA: acyl-CoA thioesterase [bacterium]|nr:acyl-CoA thioesterase [bacterium]